jgi:hypothetical protein
VDGASTASCGAPEVARMICGEPNSLVRIVYRKYGSKNTDSVWLVRTPMPVTGYLEQEEMGFVGASVIAADRRFEHGSREGTGWLVDQIKEGGAAWLGGLSIGRVIGRDQSSIDDSALMLGDVIETVNGKPVVSINRADAGDQLKGRAYTRIKLGVIRAGVSVECEVVLAPLLKGEAIDRAVDYRSEVQHALSRKWRNTNPTTVKSGPSSIPPAQMTTVASSSSPQIQSSPSAAHHASASPYTPDSKRYAPNENMFTSREYSQPRQYDEHKDTNTPTRWDFVVHMQHPPPTQDSDSDGPTHLPSTPRQASAYSNHDQTQTHATTTPSRTASRGIRSIDALLQEFDELHAMTQSALDAALVRAKLPRAPGLGLSRVDQSQNSGTPSSSSYKASPQREERPHSDYCSTDESRKREQDRGSRHISDANQDSSRASASNTALQTVTEENAHDLRRSQAGDHKLRPGDHDDLTRIYEHAFNQSSGDLSQNLPGPSHADSGGAEGEKREVSKPRRSRKEGRKSADDDSDDSLDEAVRFLNASVSSRTGIESPEGTPTRPAQQPTSPPQQEAEQERHQTPGNSKPSFPDRWLQRIPAVSPISPSTQRSSSRSPRSSKHRSPSHGSVRRHVPRTEKKVKCWDWAGYDTYVWAMYFQSGVETTRATAQLASFLEQKRPTEEDSESTLDDDDSLESGMCFD